MTNQNKNNKPDKDDELDEVQKQILVNTVRQDIKLWGYALIAVGVLSLAFAPALSFIWGFILIMLGVISFFILEPAMYIVYGVVIILLGVKNSLIGDTCGSIYSVLQFIMGVVILHSFPKYKKFYEIQENKSLKFYRLSTIFGLLSILFFLVTYYLIHDTKLLTELSEGVGRGFDMSWNMALLGVAFGFASLFVEKINKGIVLASIIANIIIFIGYVIFFILRITG